MQVRFWLARSYPFWKALESSNCIQAASIIMDALETYTKVASSVTRWVHRFEHRGRSYTLFKRVKTAEGVYYLHLQRSKKRYLTTLDTNNQKAAIDRAKVLIDSIREEKWDIVNQIRAKRSISTLDKVIEVYRKHSGVARRTEKNNVLSMEMVVRTVLKDPDADLSKVSLSWFTKSVATQFQDIRSKQYCEAAEKDDPSQREARERSYRSSRSTLNQARSLFSERPENDQLSRYKAAGLVIPDTIKEFMEVRLRGKGTKDDYHAPADEVVKKAFTKIEEIKMDHPNLYIAFWLSVGAGLRRKEIQNCDWSHFVEREGKIWVSGGIGKDGKKIEVPVQSLAVKKLSDFRKKEGRVMGNELGLEWAKKLNNWLSFNGWTETEKKMHELRAYVGSLIYRESPVAAMKFMRHKTIKQTEQFYCRYGGSIKPVDVL